MRAFASSTSGSADPVCSSSIRPSCDSAAAWKVRASTPRTPRPPSLPFSSRAAFSVNVTARIWSARNAPLATWNAMRRVIVVVLPLPAPARIATGPRTAVAAARCASFSPSRTDSGSGRAGASMSNADCTPGSYPPPPTRRSPSERHPLARIGAVHLQFEPSGAFRWRPLPGRRFVMGASKLTTFVWLAVVSVLVGALALPASAAPVGFGAKLTKFSQPTGPEKCDQNGGIPDNATCTWVATTAFENGSHFKAPQTGTIKHLKLISCVAGTFTLQIARVHFAQHQAKVVRNG